MFLYELNSKMLIQKKKKFYYQKQILNLYIYYYLNFIFLYTF